MSQKYSNKQNELARLAKALAHPARIAILQLLHTQTCCYHGDMAEEIPIAKSTLSQHLKELKNAGLIEGDITPPTTRYCIHKKNWHKLSTLFQSFLGEVALIESCTK